VSAVRLSRLIGTIPTETEAEKAARVAKIQQMGPENDRADRGLFCSATPAWDVYPGKSLRCG